MAPVEVQRAVFFFFFGSWRRKVSIKSPPGINRNTFLISRDSDSQQPTRTKKRNISLFKKGGFFFFLTPQKSNKCDRTLT